MSLLKWEKTREKLVESQPEILKWVELWLDNGKSKNTRKTYVVMITQFLDYLEKLGIRELAEITPQVLIEWQQELLSLYKPATVSNKVGCIKGFLSFCHKTGYLKLNPGSIVRLPNLSNHLSYRLPDTYEVQLLLQAASINERDQLIIETLFTLGLRVSELCLIQIEDIKGNYITINGKGNKVRRLIVPRKLLSKLLNHITPEQIYLFASQRGHGLNPLNPVTIFRMVKKYAEIAGINPNISPHWLRHYHAVESLNHGIPLHVLQKSLGHSNLSTTGVYLDAKPTECSSLAFDF